MSHGVPGVISRCSRSALGRSRISAARIARSAHSMFLDADERPRRASQPHPNEDQIQQAHGHSGPTMPPTPYRRITPGHGADGPALALHTRVACRLQPD
ncbi:hypothetical protein Franean1_0989 [Parafrankia sp. EAN1pec]|nr:hypothetical protein Franean1_0989 [Frankia sp. EAN1pec]